MFRLTSSFVSDDSSIATANSLMMAPLGNQHPNSSYVPPSKFELRLSDAMLDNLSVLMSIEAPLEESCASSNSSTCSMECDSVSEGVRVRLSAL